MSYSLGGALIKRMTLTKAWGLTPASAEIEAVGAGLFTPGSGVVINVGAVTFHGVIGDCVLRKTEEGEFLAITVPDNRILLQQDTVFCSFNDIEVLEDNVSTPGIDRVKRFVQILPDDWDAQAKTKTTSPLTAQQILQYLVSAPTVSNGWSLGGHSRLSKPVYGIDASRGKKLGNVIQEVLDQVGLMMALQGSNQLIFEAKGEGSAPSPSSIDSKDIADGLALGPDTKVRIVGDRSVYQDIPIDLEPDWNSHYESYVFEPAWVARVKSVFNISDNGEAKAKALEVTVREYVAATSQANADFGKWGEVSRMEIPLWIYLQDIVFKAYRVPRGYTINGLDLDSLELRDGLLAEVDSGTNGSMAYRTDNYYPDTKAYCIARGQPISRLDPKFLDSFKAADLDDARNRFQPVNKFNLDTKNKVVIFEDPIFVDGSGNGALFIEPNANISGLDEPIRRLVVPNANAQISPAQVRASLCFEAEVYSKWFGSGSRDNAVYVSGLNYHTLMVSNTWAREVPYSGNKTADQIAQDAGDAALTGQNTIESGGFKRVGSAGMALNGSIDRISVTLQFEGGSEDDGISEQIDYAKERAPIHFEGERELERRTKVPDAIKKIREQREAAAQVRFTAKFLKPVKRQTERPYQNIAHVLQTPIGAVHGGTQTFSSPDTWLAGQPVFVDTNGNPSQDGKIFRGIVIADNSTGAAIATATQGVVPVRVQGPFEVGDAIGIDTGSGQTAKKDGGLPLGKVNAAYSGTDIVTVPVRLGAGSGGGTKMFPWQPYKAPWTNPDVPEPDSHKFNFRIKRGYVDGLSPSNMNQEFVGSVNAMTFVWLDLQMDDDGALSSATINTGTSLPTLPGLPDPDSHGGWPLQIIVPICEVTCDSEGIIDLWPVEFTDLTVVRSISGWDGQKFTRMAGISREAASLYLQV